MQDIESEEMQIFRDSVRRMVAREVAPIAAQIDEEDRLPPHIVDVFGDMGLLQILVPEAYGGPGGTITMACVAKEEVAKHSLALSGLVGGTSIGCVLPLLHYGTEAQRQRYLPEIAKGRTPTAVAITEPQTGSDVSGIRTSARRDGDDYVINGQKVYITGGDIARYIMVFARTAEGRGHDGISSILVPTDLPGLTIGRAPKKMGYNGVKSVELFFDDLRVPVENLVGEEGRGFRHAMGILNLNRPTVAAASVGVAQGALDAALAYARERVQFGQPIAAFQAIQLMLADMAIQIEAGRALTYKVTALADSGDMDRLPVMAAMAKTFCSDMAMKVTTDAVQVFGGAGYLREHPVERYMRDAKLLQIYEGTNQIQRLTIARAMTR